MRLKAIIIALTSAIFLTGCQNDEPQNLQTKIQRQATITTVETFAYQKEKTEIQITKTATSKPQKSVTISPEINGKVSQIKVQIGQEISENQTLFTLDNSLNTDLLALQLQTSAQSEQLARISEQITNYSSSQTIDGAQIGVIQAYQNYKSAIQTKQDTIQSWQAQHDSARINISNAYLQSENAKSTLQNLEQSLQDQKSQTSELQTQLQSASEEQKTLLQEQINQLQAQSKQLESQIQSALTATAVAQNTITQSENGLRQTLDQQQSQLTQIDSQIQNAFAQYNAAINQIESAQAGAELQKINAQLQTLQAQSNKSSANINHSKREIKAPISGKITSIDIQTGQTVNPGQTVITIENDQQILIKTSLTPAELQLIDTQANVEIIYNNQKTSGKITSISPTLNPQTQKIDIEIIATKQPQLPAGAFLKVSFKLKQENSRFIPLNSIILIENQKAVRTVTNKNLIAYTPVTIGEIVQEYAEITSGLKKGDLIITTVNAFLQEGQKIQTNN